jgi:hypothetical protein
MDLQSNLDNRISISGKGPPENSIYGPDIVRISNIDHATYLGGPYRVAVRGHFVSMFGPDFEYIFDIRNNSIYGLDCNFDNRTCPVIKI